MKDVTDERGNGAIVLIPDPLSAKEAEGVDVLLYLHGHGIGFRARKVARFAEGRGKGEKQVKQKRKGKWVTVPFHEVEGMEAGTVRDVDVDHMEEQLGNSIKARSRPMLAVMPQGTHSGEDQFGENFNSDAYLNDVLAQTVAQVPRLKNMKLTPGRVIWGGHSGAGNTIPGILANAVDRKGELKSEADMQTAGVPSRLAEVVLFDAIHGGQLSQVTRRVRAQIRKDAKYLAGQPPDKQIDYLKNNGMRFRGYYTPISKAPVMNPDRTPKLDKGKPVVTGYGILYPILAGSIKSELGKQTRALKLVAAVAAEWKKNYQVIAMDPKVRHEQIMGAGKIEEVLGAVGPIPAPSASTTIPASKPTPVNKQTVQPAPAVSMQVQHAPLGIQRDDPPASGTDPDMVKWMEDWNNPDYKKASKLFEGTGRPSGDAVTRSKNFAPSISKKVSAGRSNTLATRSTMIQPSSATRCAPTPICRRCWLRRKKP